MRYSLTKREQGAAEKGALILKYRIKTPLPTCIGVEEHFIQSLSTKIKSSLDLYYHPLIIELFWIIYGSQSRNKYTLRLLLMCVEVGEGGIFEVSLCQGQITFLGRVCLGDWELGKNWRRDVYSITNSVFFVVIRIFYGNLFCRIDLNSRFH